MEDEPHFILKLPITDEALCGLLHQIAAELTLPKVYDEHPEDRKLRKKLIKSVYRLLDFYESPE